MQLTACQNFLEGDFQLVCILHIFMYTKLLIVTIC